MVDIKDNEEITVGPRKSFGITEEKAIISLAFDQPDFMASIMPYLKIEFFNDFAVRYVFTLIKYHHEQDQQMISRGLCRDACVQTLKTEDPHEEILALVDRESDPREVPIIKRVLIDWARHKAYGQIYSEEVSLAYEQGDFSVLEKVIDDAHRITNIGTACNFFFDRVDEFFLEQNTMKYTCGFPRLDRIINDGGPSKKETFCWMAPTGVGKSIALVNSGAACLRKKLNVLHISLEMTFVQTALRYVGCFTDIPIRDRKKYEDTVRGRLASIKATVEAELIIVEWPADEISTDSIHAVIDMIRKVHGIVIDVVVVDYLELLVSRHAANNKDEYIRQKRVSTELCRLATLENVLVFTASQTNRSGNENQDAKGSDKLIDLNKVAESYGKTMPMSYIVTINQTKADYENGLPKDAEGKVMKVINGVEQRNTNALCKFYVVKNRNGAKLQTIEVRINYETMGMKENDFVALPSTESSGITEK